MRKLIFVLIILWLSVNYVFAGIAIVSWNANTEPDLEGYKIYYGKISYYGQNSGIYDNQVSVGNTTSYRITNLEDNTWYYFAVTASDFSGNESKFSKEVSYLVIPDATGNNPPNNPPKNNNVYNFENPFKAEDGTTIVINTIDDETKANIYIYTNNFSVRIIEFLDIELIANEENHFKWDGKNTESNYVKADIYFCTINTNKRTITIKLAVK